MQVSESDLGGRSSRVVKPWRNRHVIAGAAIGLSAAVIQPHFVAAATNAWNISGEGNWNVAANWSEGKVPNNTTNLDSFNINKGITDVTDTETFTIGVVTTALNISGGSLTTTDISTSTLNVNAGAAVNLNSGSLIASGTNTSGVAAGEMRLAGSFVQTSGTVTLPTIEAAVNASATTALYTMNGGSLTCSSTIALAKAGNATFVESAGNVTVGNLTLIDNAVNSVVATYQFNSGSLTANVISDRGNTYASGIFQVTGSGASNSIKATTLSLTSNGSELKIGLDSGGSTLIAVSGNGTLGATGKTVTLDVNSLDSFDGSGNVADHPGWYRLASIGGTLSDSNLVLGSDTGVQYSLVSDPHYLTIAVVPEPVSGMVVFAGVLIAQARRRQRP